MGQILGNTPFGWGYSTALTGRGLESDHHAHRSKGREKICQMHITTVTDNSTSTHFKYVYFRVLFHNSYLRKVSLSLRYLKFLFHLSNIYWISLWIHTHTHTHTRTCIYTKKQQYRDMHRERQRQRAREEWKGAGREAANLWSQIELNLERQENHINRKTEEWLQRWKGQTSIHDRLLSSRKWTYKILFIQQVGKPNWEIRGGPWTPNNGTKTEGITEGLGISVCKLMEAEGRTVCLPSREGTT